ncbi:20399_t:CDS:1, partial [Racocetra persica]
IFIRLGEDIVMLYKKAEHNKHLRSYLTERANSAVAVIKDLEIRKQDHFEFFGEQTNLQLIKNFAKRMLDVRTFITNVSQLGSFGNFFEAGDIVQMYKDLSIRFDEYMNSLNHAMKKITYQYLQQNLDSRTANLDNEIKNY